MRRYATTIALGAVVLLAAGCAGGGEETSQLEAASETPATPSPVETVPAEEPEDAEPAPAWELIKDCESANTMAAYEHRMSLENGSVAADSAPGQIEDPIPASHAGPIALDVMGEADEAFACAYPLHFQGGLQQHMFKVSLEDQSTLKTALSEDPEIEATKLELPDEPVVDIYSYSVVDGPSTVNITYGFAGDILIALYGRGVLTTPYLEGVVADMSNAASSA